MSSSKHILDLREIARKKQKSSDDSIKDDNKKVFSSSFNADDEFINVSSDYDASVEDKYENESKADEDFSDNEDFSVDVHISKQDFTKSIFDEEYTDALSDDRNAFRKAFDQLHEEHHVYDFFADKARDVDTEVAKTNLFSDGENFNDRPSAIKPQFNVESGFISDFNYSVKSFFKRLRRKHTQPLNFHKIPLQEQVTGYSDGFLYKFISFIGRGVELIGLALLGVLRLIRMILFSPITVLDYLLDVCAKLLKMVFRGIFFGVYHIFKYIRRVFREFEFNPPYFWYKQVGSFALIAVLIILPIKLFFEVPKFLSAKQEVLGVSAKAISYVGLFSELKEYVPAAQVAKEFGGFNGPRRYLLIFQNNAELRATGGFMGSYALVDVEGGKVEEMKVPTGGFYDLKGYITKRVEAPQPFHIFSPYWQIWNANWFADFPASAKTIAQFYEDSTGPTVDGVVMITPNIIEDLLEVTGPIEIEEYDTVIDAKNFRRQTQVEVELEYDQEANTPKAFIGALAPKLIEKVFALVDAGRARDLLEVIDIALEEKQLLMYSTDQSVQQTIADLNWGGLVREVPGDYLQVIHTNIGGGKTDLVIKDSIRQEVKIRPDGGIVNEVTLTRTHTGDSEDIFEGHDNLDYLRFYVPHGSRLITATGFTEDDLTDRFKTTEDSLEQYELLDSLKNAKIDPSSKMQIFEENNKTVFGHWLGIKPGQTKTVQIRYELPFTVEGEDVYHIYWQKQSGTQGTPLTVSVDLLDDRKFVNWLPQDSHITLSRTGSLFYSNDLRTDRYLTFYLK